MAQATPLYHGVALCRSLVEGRVTLGPALVHVAYLVVLTVVGFVLAMGTFRRRLVT